MIGFRPGLIDLVDLRLGQLQLAAGDAESEHQLLLGGLSVRPLALEVAVTHASDDQADRDRREGGPAHYRLKKMVS